MTQRLVSAGERRARLGLRHRLTEPAESVPALADDLVVLHATDPATIYLSAAPRIDGVTVADVDSALFEDRTVLRTLAMRRTLFVASTETVPVVEGSSSGAVASVERRRLETFLADSGIEDPPGWLAHVALEVLDALDGGGPDGLQARELTKAVPTLATRIVMAAGTKHSVEAGATSRVLGLMAVEGLLIRGRPTGDWTGRQYRWFRRDRWWPNREVPRLGEVDETEASIELLRRWLHRFGPATVADMKWWTGWTMGKTRKILAAIDTAEVSIEDGTGGAVSGFLLANDLAPVADQPPWAALLPSLDPTAMGWKERDWYLGDHRAPLFDRNGNIGPTVWVDGRIVGGWSQDPTGAVVTRLLEPVGPENTALIDDAVARTAAFLGETVVKPSFPTPLQKELSTGLR
ncbi:MAG: winged helix DNA-binding domain-containing protein [Actinomycetota bacterium]